jgi:hypothetical protein
MKAMRGWALLGASLAALGLGACGGDDDNPGGGTGGADGGSDAKVDGRGGSTTVDARPDTVTADNRDAASTTDATDANRPETGGGDSGEGGTPAQRGKYLVENVGACGDCHTPIDFTTGKPDTSKFLAGMPGIFQIPGLGPDGGLGIIGSSNLTSDMTTGLGSWTDAQIKKALLDGIDRDNQPLFPIMPYYVLHNMTTADADAIVAYLRTVPAVPNAIPPRNFALPAASPPVPADKIPDPALPTTDPAYASAMRGKYLAGNFGVCMECHTEHVQIPGAVPLDLTKLFAGGESFVSAAIGLPSPPFPPVIYTSNVTPHATGIQGWTAAAVATAIKRGVDNDGVPLCPPMPVGPLPGAFGGITDSDALDIGNYITHLPPISNTIALVCHDYMSRDGGTDGGNDGTSGDGAVPPEAGPDVTPTPDATADVTPDVTTTPDATNDGAGDTGGGSDGAGDGTAGDSSTGDGAGDTTGDSSTGDGATSDAADSAG